MAPAKFQVEQDDTTGRWFVVDIEHQAPYRYPIPYTTFEAAESFMDRLNAIVEGEPTDVIVQLRGDSDELRNGQRP